MLRQEGADIRKGWQRMRQLNGITDSMDRICRQSLGIVTDRGEWHAAVCVGAGWTLLSMTEHAAECRYGICMLSCCV